MNRDHIFTYRRVGAPIIADNYEALVVSAFLGLEAWKRWASYEDFETHYLEVLAT